LNIRVKRLFDLIIVVGLSPVWLPVFGLLSATVRLRVGAPVFFRQARPGRRGQLFQLIKFRTMTDARDSEGRLFPDAQRLTPFGRWLRATSLDELPELINVLKGDMSLVGPRPLLVQYLERYTPEQARRHEVLPGVTGWAQINGRNAISWEEKFKLDVWYVEHKSWWLDLKILARTLQTVLHRDGISARDAATMPEFYGTNDNTNLRPANAPAENHPLP
jgi:lipopolysaccharide/colanic/teichoic acid biosynthesis glycosyltransferase